MLITQRLLIIVAVLIIILVATIPVISSQPFSIVSYPIPNSIVPIPGILDALDNPPPPVIVVTPITSSSSSSSSSSTSSSSDDSDSCDTGWCTETGHWLPLNVNYILIGVAVGLLMFMIREDRRTCVTLIAWAATIYVFCFVDNYPVWYVIVTIDFILYKIAYTWEVKQVTDEDEDEDEDDEKDEENEENMRDFPSIQKSATRLSQLK